MEIMNNMTNDKCVDIFYDYFLGREDNEIIIELKNLSKDELTKLVLKAIKNERSEKALLCKIYSFGMKGIKFNNEIIELSNLYLTEYPQGKDLILVLSRLAKAYISEYEIEKGLEVCEMLNEQDYNYIHSIYSECLYKINRLDEAIAYLEERLVIVKSRYEQEADEIQQKIINSIAKNLEKYKRYLEKGTVYIPATEKGREKLGIEANAIKERANRYDKSIKSKNHSDYTLESSADTDTFVAFDFETTGLKADWYEIIEIGAVKVVKGEIVDTYSTLVKAYKKISEKITEITGITSDTVADATEISMAILELKEFIEGYDLVGHNVLFDMKFLDLNLERIGKGISCKIYDTLALSRKYFKGMDSYKLIELSRVFNIGHSDAHRALSDAEATAKLYMECFKEGKNGNLVRK